MTGLVRKATLLAVLGLLITSAVALAGIPDPAHCTYPSFIDVMGNKAGVIDPYGAFNVTVLDIGSNPVVGCAVTITISCTDIALCTTPASAGVTITNPAAGVAVAQAFTNASGVATFDLAGAARNSGALATGCGYNGAAITLCNSISLGTATVAAFDENGAVPLVAGVEISDLSAWMKDFGAVGTIGYKGRSDYSHANGIDIVDLSKWLVRFGTTNSGNGCAGNYTN